MRKQIVVLMVLFSPFLTFCQKILENGSKADSIYNFFTAKYEDTLLYIGQVELMPMNSYVDSSYSIMSKNPEKGIYLVFIGNKILFKYELKNSKLNGLGYCFYPLNGRVAVQAEFKNNLLDGLVIVQDIDGSIIEIMKYKNGCYKKNLFHFQFLEKKKLRQMKKRRSPNPLRGDEVIINY